MSDVSESRFVVRQGAVKNTWMVWDRKLRGPAILGGLAARFESEEQARELRDKLTREQAEWEKPRASPGRAAAQHLILREPKDDASMTQRVLGVTPSVQD